MQWNLSLRRPAGAVTIAMAASLAIAACGGSSSPGAGGTSTTDAGLRFASCIRAHGVPDYPDPGSSGGVEVRARPGKMTVNGRTLSESPRVVQTAMKKCQKYAPVGRAPKFSAAQLAKLKAGALAMAKCMRAHGVPNFPDPQVMRGADGRGVAIGIRAGKPGPGKAGVPGFDPRSPTFQAAQKVCQPLMNKNLPGGPPRQQG